MNIRGANASAVIRGINEKQCVDLCAINQDHKGRTVLCASVVYEGESQECRMFRRASFPDGEMERKPEEGRRYFEKFCLPEEAPAQCGQRQFVRVDDYILKGYAQSTTTVREEITGKLRILHRCPQWPNAWRHACGSKSLSANRPCISMRRANASPMWRSYPLHTACPNTFHITITIECNHGTRRFPKTG